MKYWPHDLFSDVIMIEPRCFNDARGYFFEGFQANRYADAGLPPFVQDNFSRSSKNTLRGLHYQLKHPQGKLIGVTSGKVYDVVVDIRQSSPTFGRWISFELSMDNCMQIYIPPGYAHGFCVMSDTADFYYKCTTYYAPTDEYGLIWNDPLLNIDWPLLSTPILSVKDQAYPTLQEIHPDHLPRCQS